jgi:hypothetical protein
LPEHGTLGVDLRGLLAEELITDDGEMDPVFVGVHGILVLWPRADEFARMLDAELPLRDVRDRAKTREDAPFG